MADDLDALLAAQATGQSGNALKAADPLDAMLSARASGGAPTATDPAIAAGQALNAGIGGIPRQLGLTARYGIEGLANTAQVATEPLRYFTDMLLPDRSSAPKSTPLGVQATKLADAIGLPSPQTPMERVVGDATRLVAGSGGMAGGAALASQLPGTTGAVMGGLASNPVSQLTSAAGAGLAGGASREAGGNGWLQAGASLLGGVTGGLAPSVATAAANGVKSLLTPKLSPQEMDVQLTAILGKSGQDYSQLAPNVRASLRNELADALKTGQNLDPAAVARLADFKTVGATPTRGMISLDPVQITREQNLAKIAANSGDSQLHGLPQLQNQNNEALIGALNKSGAAAGDPFQAGQNAISAITAKDAALKSSVSDLYNTARNMPGGEIPLNRAAVVNGIYDALNKENKLAYLPPDISKTLNSISLGETTINGQKFTVPFDAKALDNLMTDIATAQRGTQDGNVKAALMLARKAIDNVNIAPVKASFGGNQLVTQAGADFLKNQDAQAPAFLDALNQARAAHAARMGWQDSSAPVNAALNGAQPDNFVKRFVLNGSLADVKAVAEAAPNSGMKEAILSHLKDRALNSASDEVGKFSQSAFNKALGQIGDRKLSVFFSPEELNQLKAVGRASSYMQAQPVGSAVNNSNSGALVLGRGADFLGAMASKIPMGKQIIADPLRNINISLTQKAAQNVVPGLLFPLEKPPVINSMLLPGAAVAGGLLSP